MYCSIHNLLCVAGLFDEAGKLLGSASSPIQIWKEGDCVELLWMKENLQESWSMAWRWMDISSG
ncbi:hypothetical protein HanIR_Chr03g0146751 [Helianthus annuus]|nr:hypothetical protein HanIR_Chr03g0146751 [Helianthus annuus]